MGLKAKLRLVFGGAFFEAFGQLTRIRHAANSPWQRSVSAGHQRGIDHYTPTQLIWTLATAMRRYRLKFGHYPNLMRPTSFNEKVMWFKFFGELKVPESGNKLATHTFIPETLRPQLSCPPLVWQSDKARLPANDDIAPGVYYLKASHGSRMFERVVYPLSDEQRARLEAKSEAWLSRRYGWDNGEWWYNVFKPRLLLEHSVTGINESISWNFYVLNGQVPLVGMFLKTAEGRECSTWLDGDFKKLPWQSILPPVPDYEIGPRQHEMMRMALEIARPLSAVRVDFLLGEDERIYLCELTFSPGNAMSRRAPEVEALMSAPWTELR